jgi:cytochrome c peroxidase
MSASIPSELSRDASPNSGRVWLARLAVLLAVTGFGAVVWSTRDRGADAPPAAYHSAALDALADRPLVLGEAALFAGIPGGEKPTLTETLAWLHDPRVHEPLDFRLPLWLRGSEAALRTPSDDPLTLAKIELGRQLFMERRIVGDGSFTCVECHHPDAGYSRASMFSEHKNPPAVVNRILSTNQFWDGRADSLEQQVLFPLTNAQEMKSSPERCEEKLAAIPGYRAQFERIYGKLSYENMTRAIAAFERALVTGSSPYDYYRVRTELESRDPATLTDAERQDLNEAIAGTKSHPMTDAAQRGMELFFSDRTGCANCHSGPNFTDEKFHNLGVGHGLTHVNEGTGEPVPDVGRYHITHDEADRGAFKTPTLRNLRDTGPYFHDGTAMSLETAVAFIANGGKPNPNLSPLVQKLDLSPEEINDLVAFLDSLNGELAKAPTDRLPE